MSEIDTVLVLGAYYDNRDDAEADYEAVKALYYEVETSHDFDAAVIERDDEGKVHVQRKHEQPTRHGAAVGLGWGFAVGVATAIVPAGALGGALVTAGTVGGAVGAVAGHVRGGMSGGDLKQLGEVLETGQSGLIAVYETNLADQVAANIKAVNRFVSAEIDARTQRARGPVEGRGGRRGLGPGATSARWRLPAWPVRRGAASERSRGAMGAQQGVTVGRRAGGDAPVRARRLGRGRGDGVRRERRA